MSLTTSLCASLQRELQALGGSDSASMEDAAVFLRVVPAVGDQQPSCVQILPGGCGVDVMDPTSPSAHAKRYHATAVLSPEHGSSDAWTDVGIPVAQDVKNGFSCTLVSYGQSGSGKSGFVFDLVHRILVRLVDAGSDGEDAVRLSLAVYELWPHGTNDLGRGLVALDGLPASLRKSDTCFIDVSTVSAVEHVLHAARYVVACVYVKPVGGTTPLAVLQAGG
jgi:hypothetical protein